MACVCVCNVHVRRRRGVCKEGVFVLVVVSKTHLELIIHTDTSNENNAWHLDFIQFLFLIYHNVVCICKKDATCTYDVHDRRTTHMTYDGEDVLKF